MINRRPIQTRYYKDLDTGNLYSVSMQTLVVRHRNTVKKIRIIDAADFDKLNKVEIKNDEFSRLMNIYFKDVEDEWDYDGYRMMKLKNFNDERLSVQYNIHKFPKHDCGAYGQCLLVYHWGRVYYFTYDYGGYGRGQLLDVRTKSAVRWAKPDHCAPIFNFATTKII